MDAARGRNGPIGVFGGTFDPVHHGHLRVALDALELLALREVRFIPSARPPHRDTPGASPRQRLRLLRLALAGQPAFIGDDRELVRAGRSYTIDTLASLAAEYPDRPLCLLLGVDAYQSLPTWHRWRELGDYAHLVVLSRPGYTLRPRGELAAFTAARRCDDPARLQRPAAHGGVVYAQTVTPLEISATALRAQIAAGRSPRYLTPDAVCVQIDRERLYRPRRALTTASAAAETG